MDVLANIVPSVFKVAPIDGGDTTRKAMEAPVRYEVSGVGVDSRISFLQLAFAYTTFLVGAGALYLFYLIHFRRGNIVIDTDEDVVSTRQWSVPFSQIDNIDGEQEWHFNRDVGNSTTVTITLLGDFGSRSVDFKSRQKAMEFLNFLRKARSGDKNTTIASNAGNEVIEETRETVEEIEERIAEEKSAETRRRRMILIVLAGVALVCLVMCARNL